MGKVFAILAACVVAAAGGAYALYSARGTGCVDAGSCPVATVKCCAVSPDCPSASDETAPSMAVAGPAALFSTQPVKAEVASCCMGGVKAVAKHSCCAEAEDADTSLIAVTGAAITVAKK